jgi:anti-sigma factor RsiW
MPPNPACQSFIPLLSPFIDGELSPSERVNVERHINVCKDCAGRAADLRAESGLVRIGLEMAADEVDFKDFAQKVMARVTPERPPLWERVRISASEMFRYQRPVMMSSFATAVVLALVAVPLLLRDGTPVGYAGERMTVETVTTADEAKVAPVVMETQSGDAIIWLVDHESAAKPEPVPQQQSDELDVSQEAPDLSPKPEQDKPTGGEL